MNLIYACICCGPGCHGLSQPTGDDSSNGGFCCHACLVPCGHARRHRRAVGTGQPTHGAPTGSPAHMAHPHTHPGRRVATYVPEHTTTGFRSVEPTLLQKASTLGGCTLNHINHTQPQRTMCDYSQQGRQPASFPTINSMNIFDLRWKGSQLPL